MLQRALISPPQPTKSDLQYTQFVKPSFDEFILPSKKHADVIIPRGADNDVAIDLIVQHIQTKLGQHDLCKIYPNVFVVHATYQVTTLISTLKWYVLNSCRKKEKWGTWLMFVSPLLQLRGMHTLIRDVRTTKHDFVFYADRLIRLVWKLQ